MTSGKRFGLGIGGAVGGATAATLLATCPVAQGAALGALGALGLSRFLDPGFRPLIYVVAVVCGALLVYAGVRVRRRRVAPMTGDIVRSPSA